MKTITSNTEKLILGVNCKEKKQTTWDGKEWISYIAKIGNSSFCCLSLTELQESIFNYEFKDDAYYEREARAIEEFGTSA